MTAASGEAGAVFDSPVAEAEREDVMPAFIHPILTVLGDSTDTSHRGANFDAGESAGGAEYHQVARTVWAQRSKYGVALAQEINGYLQFGQRASGSVRKAQGWIDRLHVLALLGSQALARTESTLGSRPIHRAYFVGAFGFEALHNA